MYSRVIARGGAPGALCLRPTAPEDIPWVVRAERAPENSPFVLDWGPEKHLKSLKNPDTLHLVIETGHGKKAGYAILNGLQNAAGNVELMRIVVTEKGKGIGKQAITMLMRHFFEQSAHRFWLDVVTGNAAAIGLYEKLGFVTEGVLRECLVFNGRRESMRVMSVLAREYRESGSDVF